MLTIKKKLLVAALIVSATEFAGKTPHVAWGAEQPMPSASVRLGLAVPLVGDLKDIADPGIAIGAQALHRLNAHEKIGLDVSYLSFGKDTTDQVDTEVSIISMLALVHRDLSSGGGAAPFFETGFGFARTQVNIAASNAGGPAITRGNNEEDISPTIMLGLGFDTPISGGATFGLSVDYQHFFFKVGDVDGGGSLSLLAHLRV